MQLDSLASTLTQELQFDFTVEGKTVVSHVHSDMYTYRLEVEELPPQRADEMLLQVSIVPGYGSGLLFDFRGTMPRCQQALFSLQSGLCFGRLELNPVGRILTVSLREVTVVRKDEDTLEEFSLEEMASDAAEEPLGRLLLEMFEIAGLLREISLTGNLNPYALQLLRGMNDHGGLSFLC